MNPAHEAPYSGPIGSVHGVVHVTGDAAPELPGVLAKIPVGQCNDARAFYGKMFREGPDRELADVLVAVTDYKGYLPAKAMSKTVVARGCAFDSRTVALTFGQVLMVKNESSRTFIPQLIGAREAALLVAVPRGEPIPLFPDHVGEYSLQDQTQTFATADVFVLRYPTVAVTGLDGAFDIRDLPAGPAVITAYLPAAKQQASQHINIVAGEATTINLVIPFKNPKAAAP